MMQPWAVRLRRSEAAAAVVLRHAAGLEVAEADGFVWIRGHQLDDQAARQLRCLTVTASYAWWPDGRLVVQGQRVPTKRLPDATWLPIRDWFEIELPAVIWPGLSARRIALRLVRSNRMVEANLLVTSIGQLLAFGAVAPAVRLDSLRFATCTDDRVIVQGHPLPSLPGMRLVCMHGVAVPAGWRWEPEVEASVLADVLQVADTDVALLSTDAASVNVELVTNDQFVRASRASIRATAEALTRG